MRVARCDEGRRVLFGRLDSQPAALAEVLRLGQETAVSFENVHQHKKPADF